MAGKGFSLCKLLTNSLHTPFFLSRRNIGRHVSRVSRDLKLRQEKYFKILKEEELIELKKRSNFIEWNYSAEVFAFGKRLQEEFPSELLVQAFTHRSYIISEELKQKKIGIEKPEIDLKDNSSLILEGEKIISHYVPRYISYFLTRFPLEGIEAIHDYLLSDDLLAHVSKNLGTTYLILTPDFPVKTEIYAGTFKAIVGALSECRGVERAQLFTRDFVVTQMAGKDVNDFLNISDPLEVLKEILKRDGKEPPEPRLIFQSAMNTIFANYHVGIYCNKQLIGHCSGECVKTAIEMAAFDALKRLFHTTDSCSPITYDLEKVPEKINNLRLSEWSSSAFEKKVTC